MEHHLSILLKLFDYCIRFKKRNALLFEYFISLHFFVNYYALFLKYVSYNQARDLNYCSKIFNVNYKLVTTADDQDL